jgi:hypothetical protein
MQLKFLISVVSYFYDVDITVKAKSWLLEDISILPTGKDLTDVPRRLDNSSRLAREIENIMLSPPPFHDPCRCMSGFH